MTDKLTLIERDITELFGPKISQGILSLRQLCYGPLR